MKHRPDEVDAEARVRSGDARVTRNKPDASAVSAEERIAIDACPSPYLTHGDRVCSYCLPLAEKIEAAVAAERDAIIALGNVLWNEYASDVQFGAAQQAAILTYMDDIRNRAAAVRGGDDAEGRE